MGQKEYSDDIPCEKKRKHMYVNENRIILKNIEEKRNEVQFVITNDQCNKPIEWDQLGLKSDSIMGYAVRL